MLDDVPVPRKISSTGFPGVGAMNPVESGDDGIFSNFKFSLKDRDQGCLQTATKKDRKQNPGKIPPITVTIWWK
jgi:hypothetical protein